MALATASAPTLLIFPLAFTGGFGPCGPAFRGGWGRFFAALFAAGGIASFCASIRYFMLAARQHKLASWFLGVAMTFWNAMLSYFLLFVLVAAILS